MSGARVAADLASTLPMDHPLAQVARLRLDAHVRAERKTMKIESPDPGFTGISCGVEFKNGVGSTSDPAAINYFQSAGYKVGGKVLNPVREPDEPLDPRTLPDEVRVGAPLRDALAGKPKARR